MGSSEATSLAPSWFGACLQDSCDDDRLSSFFDPWYCIAAEGNPLRTRLAESIEAAERLLRNRDTYSRRSREDVRLSLEHAYDEFLRFKTSRSAWQDIHGSDPSLLAAARKLLDTLQ